MHSFSVDSAAGCQDRGALHCPTQFFSVQQSRVLGFVQVKSTAPLAQLGLDYKCPAVTRQCCHPIRATNALTMWLHACVGVAISSVKHPAMEARGPSKAH